MQSGAKNVRELSVRARLRRNVQWMSGVAPLTLPTLSEMDKLLEKVRGRRAHRILPPAWRFLGEFWAAALVCLLLS